MSISLPSYGLGGISESDINIEINPQIPVPGKTITATVSTYSTDLNKAFIEWRNESNTILSSGTGNTSYTMTAENVGINILVYITPIGESAPIIKQISIEPSNIDILWEATDSYTPPFYKGKALPTSESIIKAVAMPNSKGVSQNKNENVYLWKLEHNSIQKASGYGKDTFIFKNSYLRDVENIEVEASSVTSNYLSANKISVPINDSKILFYLKGENGVVNYNKAMTESAQISTNESTIVAEPYFFLIDDNGGTNYDWRINGKNISTPRNPRILTIRPESSGGYATITFTMESVSRLFQNVSNTLRLNL